jgi:hypothetical protein
MPDSRWLTGSERKPAFSSRPSVQATQMGDWPRLRLRCVHLLEDCEDLGLEPRRLFDGLLERFG